MHVLIDVKFIGQSEYRPMPIGDGLCIDNGNIIGINHRKKVSYVNTNFISRIGHVHSDRIVSRHR
jgi:hypothetical protein